METKICIKCGEVKDVSDFYKGMNTCKVCFNKNTRAITMKNIERIHTYLSDKSCILCGEADPIVLDFHHEDPTNKVERVANMKSRSWPILLAEIEKCSVLCSNCHRKVHYSVGYGGGRKRNIRPFSGTIKVCHRCAKAKDTSLFYKNIATCIDCVSEISKTGYIKRSNRVNEYKSKYGCKVCGVNDYKVLDFHHIDPSTKINKIANLMDCSWDKVKSEINKCELVCSNCHRREHSNNWYIPDKEVK